MSAAWEECVRRVSDIERIAAVQQLLSWDQQVQMPPKAAAGRGDQAALLARLRHEWLTDPRLSDAVAAVADDPDPVRRAGARNLRRAITRATALPVSLVERLARLEADGFGAWHAAKQADDVALFAPVLAEIIDATRARAACIDPHAPAYDVLLSDFDPGTTAASLAPMFDRLRAGLTELLDAIDGAPALPTAPFALDAATQLAWHHDLIGAVGYDLGAGRLDLSAHPFTIRPGDDDVRITTRIDPHDVIPGLGSTLHEMGHALYEQGLPRAPGTGIAEAASMGLHESQSRFWENAIGRSLPFLRWAVGRLGARVAQPPSAEQLYRRANRVERGLIRVDADEVTYNLHVILRFEMERRLFGGDLAPADLPGAWDELSLQLLGQRPPSAASGVLQDVHWATTAFGYFPSYTLGNLYAASLAATLEAALPAMWEDVERGQFGAILGWLRAEVHQHGHIDDAPDRMRAVVGERDHVADLLDALWRRHGALYGVSRR